MKRLKLRPWLCLTLILSGSGLEARPKEDIPYLKNGDRMTVEIKTLDQGQLTVKTEYTIGTFVIDWREVERIESPQRFRVETRDGVVMTGFLRQKPGESQLAIQSGEALKQLPGIEVVRTAQDEDDSTWRRP